MIVRHRVSQHSVMLAALVLVGCPSGQSGAGGGSDEASTANISDTTAQAAEPVKGDTIDEPTLRRDTADSGIEGRVTIGPTCPAPEVGRDCPAKPYATTLLLKDSESGEVLHRIRSDEEGRFRLPLPAGSYVVEPPERKLVGEPEAEPVHVTVQAGQWTPVRVRFDSGAR